MAHGGAPNAPPARGAARRTATGRGASSRSAPGRSRRLVALARGGEESLTEAAARPEAGVVVSQLLRRFAAGSLPPRGVEMRRIPSLEEPCASIQGGGLGKGTGSFGFCGCPCSGGRYKAKGGVGNTFLRARIAPGTQTAGAEAQIPKKATIIIDLGSGDENGLLDASVPRFP